MTVFLKVLHKQLYYPYCAKEQDQCSTFSCFSQVSKCLKWRDSGPPTRTSFTCRHNLQRAFHQTKLSLLPLLKEEGGHYINCLFLSYSLSYSSKKLPLEQSFSCILSGFHKCHLATARKHNAIFKEGLLQQM